jgi:Protein of unknown function (DUF3754)
MSNHSILEHYIPVRVVDLVNFLASGTGDRTTPNPLPEAEQARFRDFAEAVSRRSHLEFNHHYRRLKDAYSPFDPDRETAVVEPVPEEQKREILEKLYREITYLLHKANYQPLTKSEVIRIIQGSSHWGLEMDVDWSVFDHIDLFYRGDVHDRRPLRRWWKLWFKEVKIVAEFNRLVLVLRQRPHKRLGPAADTNSVYLKMFKDMPKPDLEMVLPGSRVKLSKLDKGLIFYPVVSGIALIMYKVLADFFDFKDIFALGASVSLTWGLAAAFAGYGYKSYMSYSNKKTWYSYQLAQSLYYQGIDSNAGVFHRLLDEAEEQETREVLLAYYYLWRDGGDRGLTAYELDERIQAELKTRLGLTINYEILDGLGKLLTMNVVERNADRYRAVPIPQATVRAGDTQGPGFGSDFRKIAFDVPLSLTT